MRDESMPGETVAVKVEEEWKAALNSFWVTAYEGRRDDAAMLREDGDEAGADRAAARAARYERLVAGVAAGELVGTVEDLRAVLTEYLGLADEENDYERTVAEHDAFAGLLARLPE